MQETSKPAIWEVERGRIPLWILNLKKICSNFTKPPPPYWPFNGSPFPKPLEKDLLYIHLLSSTPTISSPLLPHSFSNKLPLLLLFPPPGQISCWYLKPESYLLPHWLSYSGYSTRYLCPCLVWKYTKFITYHIRLIWVRYFFLCRLKYRIYSNIREWR